MGRWTSGPSGPRTMTRTVSGAALAAALVLAGCAGDDTASDGRPVVVATTSVLADLVGGVAGDTVRVTTLIPPGVDPHRFAPSTRDATRLREADLVVAIGLGLESGLEDTLASSEADGVPVLELGPLVDPLPAGGDDEHEDEHGGEEEAEEDDGHGHGEFDPHVWLDPLRMADAAGIVAARLAELEGAGGLTDAQWTDRGRAYADRLRKVDDEVVELLATVPDDRRLLVTDHDSLRYFAERYGFEIAGTFLPGTSTDAQASTRAIAELADLLRDRAIPAVFIDATGESERLARTLVAEIGGDAEIIAVYTGGLGPEGSGAETLVGLLRTNASRIVDGLGSRR